MDSCKVGRTSRVKKGKTRVEGRGTEKRRSLSQLFPSHLHAATRNAADWWLSHWISQLKETKNSSQEAPAPTTLYSAGFLSAQLLLFSPGSI